jgi:type II secretory pathway pseudopilin PulG
MSRWTRRAGSERGDTIIEVLVGALMLALIVSAASTLFSTGNDSALGEQRDSQLISVADQAIETIRQEVKTKGFDELAMTSAPATGATTTESYDANTPVDPNYYAKSSTGCGSSTYNLGYAIQSNWDDSTSGPPAGVAPWSGCTDTGTGAGKTISEPLEILPAASGAVAGFVTPQTTTTVGDQTVTVDEYVTDTYLGCETVSGAPSCPGVSSSGVVGTTASPCTWPTSTLASTTCADARRVVVAVIPASDSHENTGQSSPVYVSTIFTNPLPTNQTSATVGLTLGLQLG